MPFSILQRLETVSAFLDCSLRARQLPDGQCFSGEDNSLTFDYFNQEGL